MSNATSGPAPFVQVRRVFQTPREKVFAAWTQRRHLEHWLCRDNPQNQVQFQEYDFRLGGGFRFENHLPDGSVVKQWGTYREATPPEALVFTWCWQFFKSSAEKGSEPEESLVTVKFRDLGGSTEVTLTHELIKTENMRKSVVAGWNGCFDQLARYLLE
jgi:uncharacterized protein YndB with AHSA1/START domain